MKNFIKISLIAVLLMSSAGLYASEGDFSFSVKRVNEKAVTFVINETQVLDVSIYGTDNELLYEKQIKAIKGSSKTYDLNSLSDGNYTFKLATALKSTEYKIQIKGGKASVSNPLTTDLLSPVFTKKNEVVTLSLANAPEGPIEIEILDQNNGQMYSQVFEGGTNLIKKFGIARRDIKELTFIIRSANQFYTKTVQM